jgi:ubiquinone biosynthesis protein COQ4
VHDLWHVIFGLNKINIESELALKAIEWTQTGLPMNLLSVLFGPLNLDSEGRQRFYSKVLPWAVQAGNSANFLMNFMYEEKLGVPLELVREELNIQPFDD